MKAPSPATTGRRKGQAVSVRYEVHREREPGRSGVDRGPLVEEFYGLDRARVAALSHALDGPSATGDRFTGVVRILRSMRLDDCCAQRSLIDVIDEGLASRLLNEARLPRADQLAVPLDRLQAELDALVAA